MTTCPALNDCGIGISVIKRRMGAQSKVANGDQGTQIELLESNKQASASDRGYLVDERAA
jgi:hypothetical protein